MTKRTKTVISTALTSIFFGCTTLWKKDAAKNNLHLEAGEEIVVHQAGRKNPVYSQRNRAYWLDMRAPKQAPLTRIYATLATGEANSAIQMARAYLHKHPGHVDGLVLLAAALALDKKYNLAAYYASLVLKKKPGDAVALNIQGLAHMLTPGAHVKDLQHAARLFREAFETHAMQVAPGLNLGRLQLELGDAANAMATFQDAKSRCSSCIPALMGFGVAASRSGKFDQAVASFQEVLSKKPHHTGALYHLALVHKNGYNDKIRAEKYLQQLIAENRSGDVYMKERAHSVLRMLKSTADIDERIARGNDDAELMLTELEND